MKTASFTPSVSFQFIGKTVAISGACGGIGSRVAAMFYEAGANRVLIDQDALLLAQASLCFPDRARTVVCDQSRPSHIDRAVQEVGVVDIFINNAGMVTRCPLLDLTYSQLQSIVNVNLTGAMLMAVGIARLMVSQKSGVVVNVSSQHAFSAVKGRAAYSVTKAGIVQFTRTAAHEWAEHGIRVVAVAPGPVDTPMTAALTTTGGHQALLDHIPLGRFSSANEMAGLILFLSSDLAATVLGQTLIADGGYVLA
jgi:NAD(P)-dependent dehydrogenase (short-subunit alcohol dehydrogenase family)